MLRTSAFNLSKIIALFCKSMSYFGQWAKQIRSGGIFIVIITAVIIRPLLWGGGLFKVCTGFVVLVLFTADNRQSIDSPKGGADPTLASANVKNAIGRIGIFYGWGLPHFQKSCTLKFRPLSFLVLIPCTLKSCALKFSTPQFLCTKIFAWMNGFTTVAQFQWSSGKTKTSYVALLQYQINSENVYWA